MQVFIKMKAMNYFINFYIDSHFAMVESSCNGNLSNSKAFKLESSCNGNFSNGKAFKFCSMEQHGLHSFLLTRALIHKTLYKCHMIILSLSGLHINICHNIHLIFYN